MSSDSSSISGLEPFWPRGIKTHGCNVLVARTAYSPFPVRRQPFDSPKDLSSTDIGIGDQRKTGADASDTATRSWRRTASSAAALHFKFRFELLHPTDGHVTKSRSPSPAPKSATSTTTTTTMQSLSPFSVATSSEGDHITIPDANRSKRRPSYLLQRLLGRHNSKDRDSKEKQVGSTPTSSAASSIHAISEGESPDSPPPVPPKYALLPRKIIPHIASFSTEDLRQFTSGAEFGKPYLLHDEDSTSDGTSTLLSASMSSLASGTTLAFTESSPCDPKTCSCGTSPSSACSSTGGKFPLATRGGCGVATHYRSGSGNSGHGTPASAAQPAVFVVPAPSVATTQRRMTRVSLVPPRRAPPPSPISAQFAQHLVISPTSVPSTPTATAQPQPQMVISPTTSRSASPSPLPLPPAQAQTQTQSPSHSTSSGSQMQSLHPRTALAMDISRPIVTNLDLNVTSRLSMKIQQGPISPTLPSNTGDESESTPPTVPPKPHLKPKSKSTPPSAQSQPTLSPDELQAMLDRFSFTIQDDDAPSAPQLDILPHSQSSTSISTMVPMSSGSVYGHSTPARSATPTMFNSSATATAAMTTTMTGGLIASPTPALTAPTVCHTPLSPPPWHRRAAASPSPSSKDSASLYKYGRRSESPSKFARSTPSSRKGSLNSDSMDSSATTTALQAVVPKGRHRSGSQSLSTIPLTSFSLGLGSSRHAREPAISPSASQALALRAQEGL